MSPAARGEAALRRDLGLSLATLVVVNAIIGTGIFVLRKREPTLIRPFRVPLYPLTPLVFLAGAACVLLGSLARPNALFALGALLAGVPVYFVWKWYDEAHG